MTPRRSTNGLTRTITLVGGVLAALALLLGAFSAFYMTRADAADIHRDQREQLVAHEKIIGHPVITERVDAFRDQLDATHTMVKEQNRMMRGIVQKLRVIVPAEDE